MLTWNRRDSTPLSAAPRAPKGDQRWIFWSYKSLSGLPESGPYRIFVLVFNWNHFEMRFLNLRINFYLLRTFCPHLGRFFFCFFFLCCFFFHYVSAKFHLWPSSGDLPQPRIGMQSLVTVSPVITAFHSCCLSHHVFDQVNLWPAWVGFETVYLLTMLTWNRRDSTPLSAASRAPKGDQGWIFWSYKSLSGLP